MNYNNIPATSTTDQITNAGEPVTAQAPATPATDTAKDSFWDADALVLFRKAWNDSIKVMSTKDESKIDAAMRRLKELSPSGKWSYFYNGQIYKSLWELCQSVHRKDCDYVASRLERGWPLDAAIEIPNYPGMMEQLEYIGIDGQPYYSVIPKHNYFTKEQLIRKYGKGGKKHG